MKKAQKSTPKTPTKTAGKKPAAKRQPEPATMPRKRYRIEFADGSAPREIEAAYPHVAEETGRRMSAKFFRAVEIE